MDFSGYARNIVSVLFAIKFQSQFFKNMSYVT